MSALLEEFVIIRKLRRPPASDPSATLRATLKRIRADGSEEEIGAWFGTDRDELEARVLKFAGAK